MNKDLAILQFALSCLLYGSMAGFSARCLLSTCIFCIILGSISRVFRCFLLGSILNSFCTAIPGSICCIFCSTVFCGICLLCFSLFNGILLSICQSGFFPLFLIYCNICIFSPLFQKLVISFLFSLADNIFFSWSVASLSKTLSIRTTK